MLAGVVQQVIEQLMNENGSAAAPVACVYDNVDEAVDNAVVFNPHPSARRTSTRMVGLLHQAIVEAGGPPGIIATVRNAADCIVNGAIIIIIIIIIINNFCTCENEVIVVDEVADSLINFMQETGKAYLLSPAEVDKITRLVVNDKGKINLAYIGRNVQVILKEIGVTVDDKCRVAIFDPPLNHPLVWLEQMMPILPIVCVPDVQAGIRLGVEGEQGNRHTAIMHSTNVDNLTAFARAVKTTFFVKNGLAYAGIGLDGEGHTTFTIAGPTGEGLTSARSFTRQRRCTLVEGFRIL